MSEVHEIAARGFGAEAEAYDRARPSYPPEAIAWLTENLGIGPGRRVVDLAAGTGKLTALLAGSGADLVAIEPVAAMRDQLRRRLPDVQVLAGVAEALPLATSSVDAVLVAQAFHWFDARAALAELGRVVRPGGYLSLIWNARDLGVDWVDRIWSVMDRVEHAAPWRETPGSSRFGRQPTRGRDLAAAADPNGAWSSWTEASFHHVHHSPREHVVDRMRSVSHVAALPPGPQAAVLDEIRTILREHPQTRDEIVVGIPYRVDVMYAGRKVPQT